MIRNSLCLLLAACSVLMATPASAKDWVVDYTQSHVDFVGTQSNEKFNGGFKNFKALIDFDPAKPEAGTITAVIDMASAFAGSSERDSALPQSEWFDTSKFPQALFATTKISAAGACNQPVSAMQTLLGCYKATGILTIKGITKSVTLDFSLIKEGGTVHAHGNVPLLRTDFGIGQSQWSDEAVVKYAVNVTVDIVAQPAP